MGSTDHDVTLSYPSHSSGILPNGHRYGNGNDSGSNAAHEPEKFAGSLHFASPYWFFAHRTGLPVIQQLPGGLVIHCLHFLQKSCHFIQFRNFAAAEPHRSEPNHSQH